jgi:hypothetical protein
MLFDLLYIFEPRKTLTNHCTEGTQFGVSWPLAGNGHLLSLTGASGVAVALWDSGAMVCVASAGSHAPGRGSRLQVGAGFSGKCVRTGRSLRCDDTESDARVGRQSCSALDVHSILAVPIKESGRVAGVIEVFSKPETICADDEETVLPDTGPLRLWGVTGS